MILEIPRSTTFECPEGRFAAVLTEVKDKFQSSMGESQKQIRLVFEPKIPPVKHKTVLAGKNFLPSLAQGSELRTCLDTWMGEDFIPSQTGGRFELESLIGRECEIETVHIRDPKHKNPFVCIAGIYPPSTQTSTNRA